MTEQDIDVITVDHWDCPDEDGPAILTMPNVPRALHTVAPRTVLGDTTWNFMRKACYRKANYHCEACGKDLSKATNGRFIGHCLERGTGVLTIEGWKPIEEITTDDVVAQFTPETDGVEFVHPTKTFKFHYDEIYRLGYNRGFSVGVTDDHRVLVKERNRTWKTYLAKDLPIGKWASIPAAGKGVGDDKLSIDERLLIALQADGSIHHISKDGYAMRIRVKKPRKAERLKWLIENTTYKYVELKDRDYVGYTVWVPTDCKLFKNSFSYKMSYGKAVDFIDELVKWDGWEGMRGKQPGRCYYSSIKENIDFVQAVASQAGLGTHLTESHRTTRKWGELHTNKDTSENCKVAYNLEIKKRNSYGIQTMNRVTEKYDDDVFCISIPSTYFIARTKGGDVFVSANCHELYSVDYAKQESVFERCVCLCAWPCHLGCIHTGRALTLYKQGHPSYSKEKLLEGAEYCFTIISSFNKAHPEQEPLRVYQTWLDYMKQPELKQPMLDLIEKYDIKFYKVSDKWFKPKRWENWKLLVGNRWYKTPFKTQDEWQTAMDELGKRPSDDHNYKSSFQGAVYDELDKLLKE